MSSYVRLYIQGQMTQTMTFIFKRKNLKKNWKGDTCLDFQSMTPQKPQLKPVPIYLPNTVHCDAKWS